MVIYLTSKPKCEAFCNRLLHNFMKETLSPGVLHCCFGCGLFMEGRIDGVSPAEWLKDALDGRIYDVGVGLFEN